MCADHLHVMCSGLEVKATLVAMAEACLWVSQMEYLSCSLKIRRCPREEAGQGRFIQKPSVKADAEGWATMMSAGNLEWFRVRKLHLGLHLRCPSPPALVRSKEITCFCVGHGVCRSAQGTPFLLGSADLGTGTWEQVLYLRNDPGTHRWKSAEKETDRKANEVCVNKRVSLLGNWSSVPPAVLRKHVERTSEAFQGRLGSLGVYSPLSTPSHTPLVEGFTSKQSLPWSSAAPAFRQQALVELEWALVQRCSLSGMLSAFSKLSSAAAGGSGETWSWAGGAHRRHTFRWAVSLWRFDSVAPGEKNEAGAAWRLERGVEKQGEGESLNISLTRSCWQFFFY